MEIIYSKENELLKINRIDDSLFKFIEVKEQSIEAINSKPYSYWKSVFKRILLNRLFIISFILLIIFIVLTCTIALNEVPVPVNRPGSGPESPSAEEWFGLGKMGESLWDKMWIGTRSTLLFTLVIASFQIVFGIFIGSIWGFYTKLDILFIEIVRFLNMIPSLILWLIIIFIFGGNSSFGVLVFAISLTSWISLASIIRVQIILVKNAEYNIASKVLGTKGPKIIRKNILPKILPIIIQVSTFAIPTAIALDSLLSYYNFGFVKNPLTETSLGVILNEVIADGTWQAYPYLLIIPICFIGGLSLLFFFVGKVFADSLDPKLHR